MLRPIRARLLINNLAILLLGMGLAALLSWRAVENLYLDTERENLLAQASLTAAALEGQPISPGLAEPYLQTSNTAPGIHTRLLSQQGAVVVSLPIQPGNVSAPPAEEGAGITAQELIERSEIAQAMRGVPSTAVRSVNGRRILYAAAPIAGVDGGTSGLVYLAMPLPPAGLPLSLLLQLSGAALAAAALALLAGTLISRRITRPVEEISQAAVAIRNGDLHQNVRTETTISELNSLSQSFNAMTESLRQSDRAKNAFVADVTHELRTPLTVIKGTIETLEDGAIDDTEYRSGLLSSMQRETDRLIRLVNELLILTRADAGTLNLNPQPLDLAEAARARCAQLAVLAARRRVAFVAQCQGEARVLADADRVAQVLDNLLDNALRYSPEGGVVTVQVLPGTESTQCAVSDQGAGIAPQHLPLIFERFYRADHSRARNTGGAGLGLAIVKALVLAQGGRIEAGSVEGQGTTIRFWLPNAT